MYLKRSELVCGKHDEWIFRFAIVIEFVHSFKWLKGIKPKGSINCKGCTFYSRKDHFIAEWYQFLPPSIIAWDEKTGNCLNYSSFLFKCSTIALLESSGTLIGFHPYTGGGDGGVCSCANVSLLILLTSKNSSQWIMRNLYFIIGLFAFRSITHWLLFYTIGKVLETDD